MATKQAAPVYEDDTRSFVDITFKCEGLELIDRAKSLFSLEGVRIIDFNFHQVTEEMVKAGFDRRLAEDAVEEMAESIQLKMMAKALAERMKVHHE